MARKMEGRIDTLEEQIIGIHGEIATVKGELQRMGPLEIKANLILECIDKLMQKWENSEKALTSKEKNSKVPAP